MWIVRTYAGGLMVTGVKPMRVGSAWCALNMISYHDDRNQFINLKWEDEPIEVELVRK